MNKPAIVALIKFAKVPAITAFKPKRATSLRRFGAIPPKPPIKIAIELKLAKPHNAKVMMALVFSLNTTAASGCNYFANSK
mgnify:FL=1